MPRRPRVLFVCADPVGERMAGLGIRNWELARTLCDEAEVTIAHGGAEEGMRDGIELVAHRPHDHRALLPRLTHVDVVVTAPGWPRLMRALRRSGVRLIIDLYDPETLETIELFAGRPARVRSLFVASTLDRLHDALRSGDHFMCASENQRDLWLGAMLALRMIDPTVYDRDPGYRSVIDLVPFGVPGEPPSGTPGPGPAELPGVGDDAEIVLWNGGLWQWLDAETPIRALPVLRRRRPRAALVFMGGAGDHPAARRAAAAARELAESLGLLGAGVHFNDAWVPYADRARWLGEASCAVAAAHDHLETRFAFRTRLLDCLWAGLPVACTAGDALAAQVAREDLGAVVAPGDVDGLAAGLESILDRGREAFAPRLADAAARAGWGRAAGPLRAWVHEPVGDGVARRLAPGSLRPSVAHRARDAAYSAVGWRALSRR